MKFISNQGEVYAEYAGHPLYVTVEKEGATHEDVIKDFVHNDVIPGYGHDGFDETFEVRFEDGSCFRVRVDVWVEDDPEWCMMEEAEITQIGLQECVIREAPEEFLRKMVDIDDGSENLDGEGQTVLGIYVTSPAKKVHHNNLVFRENSGLLSLERTNSGELAVRTHLSAVHTSLLVPVRVFLENGFTAQALVKTPNRDVKDSQIDFSLDINDI